MAASQRRGAVGESEVFSVLRQKLGLVKRACGAEEVLGFPLTTDMQFSLSVQPNSTTSKLSA